MDLWKETDDMILLLRPV